MALVEYAEAAILDLDDIWSFIALTRNDPTQAERLLMNLREAIELLAEQPGMGRERSDWKPGIRSFIVRRYVILYSEIDDGVLIERILSASRDISGMFEA